MNQMTVRLARKEDAAALYELNEEFNGNGLNTISLIEESLQNNTQEIVCIAECENKAIGFCCAQIKRSMCYDSASAELTELYVKEDYRRKGVATKLFQFTEKVCVDLHHVDSFQLLTGTHNFGAQKLYESLGYSRDEEIHYVKKT